MNGITATIAGDTTVAVDLGDPATAAAVAAACLLSHLSMI
jgi:hypothetical protein